MAKMNASLRALELDMSQRAQGQGQSWVQMAPVPTGQQQKPWNDVTAIDPNGLLQERFERRANNIDQEFEARIGEIRDAFQEQYSQLENQYNIERHYIENGMGIDPQQKAKQIEQLNKRYELKINDLQSRIQPGLKELETVRRQEHIKLEDDLLKRRVELNVIDRMVEQGAADPVVALQQKLQTVGVNVPIGLLKQMRATTPQKQLDTLKEEARAIEYALESFLPAEIKKRFLLSDKVISPEAYSPTGYDEDARPITREDRERKQALLSRLAQVRQQIETLAPDLNRMSNAMDTAQRMKTAGDPMADQARGLVQGQQSKQQPKPKGDFLGLGL